LASSTFLTNTLQSPNFDLCDIIEADASQKIENIKTPKNWIQRIDFLAICNGPERENFRLLFSADMYA